ncbi:MAG: hypothetical protein U0837_14335 [Dehalococcoidia bacterium]|jgi:hypothetical protein
MDMSNGATIPNPLARANTPNDAPKATSAMHSGKDARTPARKPWGLVRSACERIG